MWGLNIYSSISYAMSREIFSNDIYIFSITDNSEHETFYLGSPHLESLSTNEHNRAFYRSKALLNLLNGCLLLTDDLTIYCDNAEICYYEYEKNTIKGFRKGSNLSLIEYEELVDPFQSDVKAKDDAARGYLRDCIILIKEEPIIRQSILCLVLGKSNTLYFLTNVYKIIDNIKHDLKIPKSKQPYKNNFRPTITEEFAKYLDYFIIGNFGNYANSVHGSGILSRHGHSNHIYTKEPLDLEEIDFKIRNAINHWLRIKMINRFGYYYNVEFKPAIFEPMNDEDYNF